MLTAKETVVALFLALPLISEATPMTMDEFEALCGNGNDASERCTLYVQGMIDGVFEKTIQDAWKCECPLPPRAEELREQIENNGQDSWFLIAAPFEAFGACVAPENRNVTLEPQRIAKAVIARYRQEKEKYAAVPNVLHLGSASRFLVWVLLDEAEASCKKVP